WASSIALSPLVGAPTLANLRALQLGCQPHDAYDSFHCDVHSRVIPTLVRGMPRLEVLYLFANWFDLAELFALPLPHLRVLQVYHGNEVHRLQVLAANPTLGNLTH